MKLISSMFSAILPLFLLFSGVIYSMVGYSFHVDRRNGAKSHRLASKALIVPDDQRFPITSSSIPQIYKPYIESAIIPENQIQDRVNQLALQLLHDYEMHHNVHLLCVLKGMRSFANHSIRLLW